MKKVVLIGLLLISYFVSAQDSIVYEDFLPKIVNNVNIYDNSIGLRYSEISGKGISFTRNIGFGLAVVITGMIQQNEKIQWKDMTKTEKTYESSDILYNYGLELSYDMFKTNTSKFCAIIGLSKGKDSNVSNAVKNIEEKFTLGGGFNFQWFVHKSFLFELSGGYIYEDKDIQEGNTPKLERQTKLGFGIGVKYNF